MGDGSRNVLYLPKKKMVYCVICNTNVPLDESELLPSNLVGLRTVLDQLDISETERSTAFLRAMYGRQFTACKTHLQIKKEWPASIRICRPRKKEYYQKSQSYAFKHRVHATNRMSAAERVRQAIQRTGLKNVNDLPSNSESPSAFLLSPAEYSLSLDHCSAQPLQPKNDLILDSDIEQLGCVDRSTSPSMETPSSVFDQPELDKSLPDTLSLSNEMESLLNSPSMSVPCMWDADFMQSLQLPAFFPATPDLNAFYDYSMDENSLFHV